jgi:hypothetical protein
MAAGDLTSVANVKAQAPTLSSAADTVLGSLVTEASAFIAKVVQRKLDTTAGFSEIRDGEGGCELFLQHIPAISVATLTINAVPIVAQPADGQPGFFLVDGQVLALYGYKYTRGRKNVRITGTEGFAAVPKEIEQACIELVVAAYRRVPRGPEVNSETNPQSGSVFAFSQKDLPPFAARVLKEYRKVAPV